MPSRNGTGPTGQGSMTGKGLGNCSGNKNTENRYENGSGAGRGLGNRNDSGAGRGLGNRKSSGSGQGSRNKNS